MSADTTLKSRRLPKGALQRVTLGQSFAEYDRMVTMPGVFVETPAYRAALDVSRSKCFFVGRRGTGKTAITRYMIEQDKRTHISVLPQMFLSLGPLMQRPDFADPNRQPFRTLVAAFKRAMLDLTLNAWTDLRASRTRPEDQVVFNEYELSKNVDFDIRMITLVEEMMTSLDAGNQRAWMEAVKIPEKLCARMNDLHVGSRAEFVLLIDRIDESWDGSEASVILLRALMRACIDLNSNVDFVRPLLFLRENIFERIRETDREFARLETCVVSMDWTRAHLLELVERRLNYSQTTKLSLGGETWDYFFEQVEGKSSREFVLEFCQERPRDVLTFCELAIESAQGKRAERVSIEDLQIARRKFSESRLKDLGDEYAENYPQLQVVLARYYGLGNEFTITGIEDFITKLTADREVTELCGSWIFEYSSRDKFIRLMYDIGFWGIRDGKSVHYRSLGSRAPTLPPISRSTHLVVHPSYVDALNLQSIIIRELGEGSDLQTSGMLVDLPAAIRKEEYVGLLQVLEEQIKSLPHGTETATDWEECVGDVIRLCFYRSLTNLEPRVRDIEGRVVRDWIVANRAISGFWEMVRHRYNATQVVWECKNFVDLTPNCFHQCAYYMNDEIGRFVILCFRGSEVRKTWYEHVKRVANQNQGGIVLILSEKDLLVFIRQAINGKVKEDHIQNRFDATVRKIS